MVKKLTITGRMVNNKNDVGIAAFKRLYAQHKPHCMRAKHGHDHGTGSGDKEPL